VKWCTLCRNCKPSILCLYGRARYSSERKNVLQNEKNAVDYWHRHPGARRWFRRWLSHPETQAAQAARDGQQPGRVGKLPGGFDRTQSRFTPRSVAGGERGGDRLPDVVFIAHSGGGPGFAADMRLYPDRELGIVIIANGTYPPKKEILDLVASLDW
jgi:hypothetical protein